MEFDRFAEADQVIPELHDLNAATGLLWASAGNASPNQYPGFEVVHDGERASFTMHHSPTTYDRLSLFRDADGVWNIEQQRQRPTVESEGLAQFSRITTTQPLLPGESSMRVEERSGPHTAGEFTPESVTTSEQGLDADRCQHLLGLIRTVRGEVEPRATRLPRVRGWLARLGIARG